jgi:hypothetical protein
MMIRKARGQKDAEKKTQLEYKHFTEFHRRNTGGARAASTGIRFDR